MALVVGAPMLLVALQPDFGTALTFAALLLVSLFVVGMPRPAWIALIIAAIVGGALMWSFVLADYQRARIRTFLQPETDPHTVGYQIIQSRIAIGSGGILGKGFAEGTQSQLDFLPEKHTDFIFAVVAEAWGVIGSAIVLGLYAFLFMRGFRIALESRDAFGSHLVVGIMTMLAVHAVVNFGMVIGIMPTIGIPLPLMSYGGSSIVTTLIGVGLVLNVRMRRIANG